MGSNLTFQSRNVFSKKLMAKPKPIDGEQPVQLDNFNLFSLITLLSAALLLPVTLLVEGWRLTPARMLEMVRRPHMYACAYTSARTCACLALCVRACVLPHALLHVHLAFPCSTPCPGTCPATQSCS